MAKSKREIWYACPPKKGTYVIGLADERAGIAEDLQKSNLIDPTLTNPSSRFFSIAQKPFACFRKVLGVIFWPAE